MSLHQMSTRTTVKQTAAKIAQQAELLIISK